MTYFTIHKVSNSFICEAFVRIPFFIRSINFHSMHTFLVEITLMMRVPLRDMSYFYPLGMVNDVAMNTGSITS